MNPSPLSTKHDRIALGYLVITGLFFLIAGSISLFIRLQHLAPRFEVLSAVGYNSAYTFHGALMMFVFAMPIIPSVFGNLWIPGNTGKDDLHFPRLSLWALIAYIGGVLFLILGMGANRIHSGWSLYAASQVDISNPVIALVLTAFCLMHFSALLVSLNFFMTLRSTALLSRLDLKMPIFSWTMYITSIAVLLTAPLSVLTALFLIMRQTLPGLTHELANSAASHLYTGLYTYYSHPSVYLIILPALGLLSEVLGISETSVKLTRGVKNCLSVIGLMAVVKLALVVTAMILPKERALIDSLATGLMILLALPMSVLLGIWARSLFIKKSAWSVPTLYAFSALVLLTIGTLTGIKTGVTLSTNPLNHTIYLVAHFHSVLVGGPFMATLAGLYFWIEPLPLRFVRAAKASWLFIFTGYFFTFLPMFIVGEKLGRRSPYTPPAYASSSALSMTGAVLMAIGLLVSLYVFLRSFKAMKKI
ncbi:MAG: cbb3-type cytochrome c oxidase subunit I [Bdellovibrionales bacterium]|nr:cbb3-type cytochrome c oxidase subunit I [Bdellovibrionales bacterium]